MKFTIAIPTYNRAEVLRGAIESAVAQQGDDVEIVVCDNASTDHTTSVVQSFADPRIRYFRNETNQGGPANMQRALRESRGVWFILLCDDDRLHRDYIARARTHLDSHSHVTLYSTAYVYGREESGLPGRSMQYAAGPWENWNPLKQEWAVLTGLDATISLLFDVPFMHPVTALKRDVLLKSGGYFSDFMYGSDVVTFARVAIEGDVLFDYRIGGWYQVHQQNWSRSIPRHLQLVCRRKVNEIILRALDEKKISNWKDRATELLDRIPRRSRWKMLEEAWTGRYPQVLRKLLAYSIQKSDSSWVAHFRALLKTKKRHLLRAWTNNQGDL